MRLSFNHKLQIMLRSFGKKPSGKEKEKIKISVNYSNNQFQNPVPTTMLSGGFSMVTLFFKFLNKPKDCYPPRALPTIATNLAQLPDDEPVIVWFGHSSYLIKINGQTILVDPVFSGYAAPFKGMNKAFAGTNVFSVDDMPDIDVLVLTHDHYDHLDYETVLRLKNKVKNIVTSLGVSSHLKYWKFDEQKLRN